MELYFMYHYSKKELEKEFGISYEVIKNVGELKRGDHICYPTAVSSILYHHAIVKSVNSGKVAEVIHFSAPAAEAQGETSSSSGSASSSKFSSASSERAGSKSSAMVRKTKEDLSKFASAGKLYRIIYLKSYSADDVVKRAEEKIGQQGVNNSGYNLLANNCEHFATWCKTGTAFSTQSLQKQEALEEGL